MYVLSHEFSLWRHSEEKCFIFTPEGAELKLLLVLHAFWQARAGPGQNVNKILWIGACSWKRVRFNNVQNVVILSNKWPEERLDVHRAISFESQRNSIVTSLYLGRSSISCKGINLDIKPGFEYLSLVLPIALQVHLISNSVWSIQKSIIRCPKGAFRI